MKRATVDISGFESPSAAKPWVGGRPPHIPFGPEQLPRVCLLPGDPDRVDLAAGVLKDFAIRGNRREFRLGIGTFQGKEIAVCSTGIGGPSTEIAMIELFHLGVRTFLRIGGMGSLNSNIAPGSLAFVSTVSANSGTAKIYRRDDFPIIAEKEVVAEISRISDIQGADIIAINVMSADSYYIGQGRSIGEDSNSDGVFISRMQEDGIDGIDMESETVFAVGAALGCKYGSILTVHGNRITDEWLDDYEPAQIRMLQFAAAVASSFA